MIVATWQKITDTDCAAIYPDELEFLEGGIYTSASNREDFAIWQSGDYQLVSADRIRLQAANDAMLEYAFALASDGSLTFTDPTGCAITYQRVG